jgi:hypothetical protein
MRRYCLIEKKYNYIINFTCKNSKFKIVVMLVKNLWNDHPTHYFMKGFLMIPKDLKCHSLYILGNTWNKKVFFGMLWNNEILYMY